ncbi:hypothetical protein V6x_28650 [Gimesia chilikensis]|uniref:Uncharacterized protein n=1 Tax=Gimesia chilikensis TaxID=2605989 RepID=A0A517WD26_9PLAN|nr:hypothetical protein [Gimesia chilikensis]QDU03153.1 hypothetical protein V6x_28650 [Gimesia chilikensis]
MNDKRVRSKKDIYDPDPPPHEVPLFVTLETYSMAVVKDDETDPETVNGNDPIEVAFLQYDPNGKHKQLVSFSGDVISGSVKLSLNGQLTGTIDLDTVTESSLKTEMETIVGEGNISVSVWPGRWLLEFEDVQAEMIGVKYDGYPVYKNQTLIFDYKDARKTRKVFIPFPLMAGFDNENNVVLNAVAAGTFGQATRSEGHGWVAVSLECREYDSAGNPDL